MTDPGRPPPDPLETYVPVDEPAAPARTGTARRAGIAIGVVVALVAGLFGLAALTSDGGADTPEAAVTRLVEALVEEDVLGALEVIVPAERALLRGRVVELGDQLRRLGVLDDRLDLGNVPGADLSVEGLSLETETLHEDLAVVRASAGTARLTVKGDDLPIGPLLKGVVKDPKSLDSSEPANLADDDVMLVTIRREGRWFVSLGYTVAEFARREGKAPLPSFGSGVVPKGASSPEAAVRELSAAAAALNLRRAVELAAPGEADALHDYAPLFLPEAERAVASLQDEGLRAEVPTLELDVEDKGANEARVTITSLAVRITSAGTTFGFDYDGKCVRISDSSSDEASPPLCADTKDGELPFGRAAFSYFSLTVVKRGDAWFVSPVGSVLDALLGTLRALEQKDLAKVVEENPFALFFLLYPSPLVFGAGGFVGGEGGTSTDSGEACLRAPAEGTPETESVEVPCPPPPAPAPSAPPDVSMDPPIDAPQATRRP